MILLLSTICDKELYFSTLHSWILVSSRSSASVRKLWSLLSLSCTMNPTLPSLQIRKLSVFSISCFWSKGKERIHHSSGAASWTHTLYYSGEDETEKGTILLLLNGREAKAWSKGSSSLPSLCLLLCCIHYHVFHVLGPGAQAQCFWPHQWWGTMPQFHKIGIGHVYTLFNSKPYGSLNSLVT